MIYENLAEILINTDAKMIYDLVTRSVDREFERRKRQGGHWSSPYIGVNLGRCSGHTVAAALLIKKYHAEGRRVYYVGHRLQYSKEFVGMYQRLLNEKCPAIMMSARSALNPDYYRGHDLSGAVFILDETMTYGSDFVSLMRDRERIPPVRDFPIIVQLGNN